MDVIFRDVTIKPGRNLVLQIFIIVIFSLLFFHILFCCVFSQGMSLVRPNKHRDLSLPSLCSASGGVGMFQEYKLMK